MAGNYDQPIHPAQIRQMLAAQAQQFNSALQSWASPLEALRRDVAALQQSGVVATPRFVEDIPGPRQPYTYVVTVPFVAAATAIAEGSVTIATDGPFVCTGLVAYYKITTTAHALVGRWLPVSQLPFLIHNSGGAPAGTVDFSFKITTGGSGRQWQSNWLPGADFSRSENPYYNGISGWIDRTNTVSVSARPEFAIPANAGGDIWFYFQGYQILTPVDLAKLFGWHT